LIGLLLAERADQDLARCILIGYVRFTDNVDVPALHSFSSNAEEFESILPASVMNQSVLSQMVSVARATAKDMKSVFRILEINTSSGETSDAKKTVQAAAEIVLSIIEEQLQEDVLSLPKGEVKEHFPERVFAKAVEASTLVHQV